MIPPLAGARGRDFLSADSTEVGPWFTAAQPSTGGGKCCQTMPPPRLESRAPGRRGTPMTADHYGQRAGLCYRLQMDHPGRAQHEYLDRRFTLGRRGAGAQRTAGRIRRADRCLREPGFAIRCRRGPRYCIAVIPTQFPHQGIANVPALKGPEKTSKLQPRTAWDRSALATIIEAHCGSEGLPPYFRSLSPSLRHDDSLCPHPQCLGLFTRPPLAPIPILGKARQEGQLSGCESRMALIAGASFIEFRQRWR